jgi:hypothetical protein
VSKGSVNRYTKRVCSALCDQLTTYVKWPTEERKNVIKENFGERGFPSAIGAIDGTMIVLDQAPSFHKDRFATRKHCFAIGATVVCDHRRVFTYISTGYYGSRHDSSAYKDTPLYTQSEKYFNGEEHLLGDAAYGISPTMITPFKGELTSVQGKFNHSLSKSRIWVEHAIGILKERFRGLKHLRVTIKDEASLRRVNQIILACVVLHNIVRLEHHWDPSTDLPLSQLKPNN